MNLAYKIYVKIDTHTQKKQPKKKTEPKLTCQAGAMTVLFG